ncbi:MAG: type IV secretory system conjugative DNA transfer family protein, partial [Rhodospirillales bacterium]|nr:type IV secretory system conjugative DNA transfer family protein [Rhodospirillales bacterium]
MLAAILLHRGRLTGRTMGIAGIIGMAATTLLTLRPEALRLWPYVGQPGYPLPYLLRQADQGTLLATAVGLLAVGAGIAGLLRPQRVGTRGVPALLRGRSDNFGHADWLSMREAQKLFPGPDPAYGGIVVGEAYRVDQDRGARGARSAFDPADRATWGRGGTAPLLVDPCRTGPTHGLVLAGSGGFKTTSVGIPTLLAWTGSAVVLDPSREIGPMVAAFRGQALGHRVVT